MPNIGTRPVVVDEEMVVVLDHLGNIIGVCDSREEGAKAAEWYSRKLGHEATTCPVQYLKMERNH